MPTRPNYISEHAIKLFIAVAARNDDYGMRPAEPSEELSVNTSSAVLDSSLKIELLNLGMMSSSKKIFLSSLLVASCDAAGMTAHNVAAKRASQFEYFGPKTQEFDPSAFYNLASDRADAIQAGSPFPDYLYACGDEHDAGEEAHWTPFQIASVNYIREKYPDWSTRDRLEDGPGLVAFTMGVTSHYITDINWHGLEVIPDGEGLIRAMGYADFHCKDGSLCDEAHSAADTGGEFVAAASLDLKSWYPAKHWFLPTEDLVNIYASLNATGGGPLVEPQWINECAVLFYAGSFGVSRFGDLLYPLLAPQLGGMLLEQFFDFPVGGVDDDAAWTSFMWNRLAEWLVYGPPPDDPPPNLPEAGVVSGPFLLGSERKLLRQRELKAKRSYISSIRKILEQEPSLFEFKSLAGGGSTVGVAGGRAASDLPAGVLEALGRALVEDYLMVLHPVLQSQAKSTLDMSKLMDQVRNRVGEIKVEGKQSVAAPPLTDRGPQRVSVIAEGGVQREYFGTSVTSLRNGRDLLVGSPGAGVAGAPQEGSASLLLRVSGRPSAGSVLFEGGHGVGATADGGEISSYERFGWASTACDLNRDGDEDLVICAPSYQGGRDTTAARGNYTGRCDVFFGPFADKRVEAQRPSLSLYGDKEWGNFGHSVTSGDVDGDGSCDLVVSAPFAGSYVDISPDQHGDLSSQGAVYVFLSTSLFPSSNSSKSGASGRLEASAAADVVLQPSGSYQWFGKSLDIATVGGSTLLLVGAPVFHSLESGAEDSAVGRVYGYDLQAMFPVSQHKESLLFTLTGSSHAGSTGHAIASSATYLAFSETGWNATGVDGSSVLRAGRVVAVAWEALLATARSSPGADFLVDELAITLDSNPGTLTIVLGETFEGRYGSSLAFVDDVSLVVGAPLADDGRGRVYKVDVLMGSQEVVYSSSAVERELGKARVGQSVAVLRGADDVSGVFVGAPYSTSEAGEQAGAVFQF